MENRKNQTLDIIKLVASYMVVFLHMPLYGALGIGVAAFARFAVPLFFIVSGFFSYGISTEKIKKRAIHIFKLFLCGAAVYTLKNFVLAIINHGINGISWFFRFYYISPKRWVKLLIFNWPASSEYLWYLLALLYVYIIFYFVTKHSIKERLQYICSFALLGLHLLLGEIFSLFGFKLNLILVRNFLLLGIPFFCIGLLLKKHLSKIIVSVHSKSNWLIILAIIAGGILSVSSRFLFGANEIHMGSLIIVWALITLALKYSDKKYPKFCAYLTDCATYIYIYHALIDVILKQIYLACGLIYETSQTMQLIHAPIVCLITTILALCINSIQRRIKQKNISV